jgi:hypothetical protein
MPAVFSRLQITLEIAVLFFTPHLLAVALQLLLAS